MVAVKQYKRGCFNTRIEWGSVIGLDVSKITHNLCRYVGPVCLNHSGSVPCHCLTAAGCICIGAGYIVYCIAADHSLGAKYGACFLHHVIRVISCAYTDYI